MSSGDVLLSFFILLLFFLFQGEPDVWDKLHERAMQSASCAKEHA